MNSIQYWQTVGQWQQYPYLNQTRHDKEPNMKLNDMMQSNYLKQSDVPEEVLVTVKGLKKVNLAMEGEPPEYKWTVMFEEFSKPLAANSTNLKRMFKALGDDTDDWIGKQIVLFTDADVEFKGETVGGLRVRAARKVRPQHVDTDTTDAVERANRKAREAGDDLTNDIPF